MCATKNKKCLRFPRLVSSPASSAFLGPLAALVSLFLWYSKFRFAFFFLLLFFGGATSFYCLQNHRLASIWKKREETRAQISSASASAPNLVFFCFLVTAAFMIIKPSRTHTHTLAQHLSLSQNSRCISESHLKFCCLYVSLLLHLRFFFVFSFLIFAWANYAFCISYFEYLSFGCGFALGRHKEAGGAKGGEGRGRVRGGRQICFSFIVIKETWLFVRFHRTFFIVVVVARIGVVISSCCCCCCL